MAESPPSEEWLYEEVDQRLAAIDKQLEAMEFRKAAGEIRALWAAGNEYIGRIYTVGSIFSI